MTFIWLPRYEPGQFSLKMIGERRRNKQSGTTLLPDFIRLVDFNLQLQVLVANFINGTFKFNVVEDNWRNLQISSCVAFTHILYFITCWYYIDFYDISWSHCPHCAHWWGHNVIAAKRITKRSLKTAEFISRGIYLKFIMWQLCIWEGIFH